jgi:hypothetical protein
MTLHDAPSVRKLISQRYSLLNPGISWADNMFSIIMYGLGKLFILVILMQSPQTEYAGINYLHESHVSCGLQCFKSCHFGAVNGQFCSFWMLCTSEEFFIAQVTSKIVSLLKIKYLKFLFVQTRCLIKKVCFIFRFSNLWRLKLIILRFLNFRCGAFRAHFVLKRSCS